MYEQDNEYQNYSRMPYDNTQQNPENPGGQIPEGNRNGDHKKGSFWKKVGTSAACALVFGAVAGTTMTGINHMTGGTQKPQAVAESSTEEKETLPETSAVNEANSNPFAAKPKSDNPAADSTTEAGNSNLDVSGIVEKAMPAVVAINVKGEERVRDWFGRSQTYETSGAGSGILIGENDDEYLIVTNNHVVEGTSSMSVQFIDGTNADAELKGTDSGADVAVIAVKKKDVSDDTKGQISIAEMGDSDSLKVGQGVIAIGNALGYGQSVTVGYVSATNRTITAQDSSTGNTATVKNLLQTDAAINPGNSGGALLNMQGQVIGINESKSVDTTVEGMGYAIPISSVSNLIRTLSTQKTRAEVPEENRGYIGIQGQNVDTDASQKYNMPEGIFVYKILDDGAAASSDLKESDIITKFDGQTVSTIQELQEKLTRYEKGETVMLTVQRPDGNTYKETEVQVTLAAQGNSDGQTASGKDQKKDQSAQNDQNDQGTQDGQNEEDDSAMKGLEDFFRNGGFQFRWGN